MGAKKTVMLTDDSCHMGFHGYKELYAKKEKINLILLLHGSENKNNTKKKKTVLNSRILKMILQSE